MKQRLADRNIDAALSYFSEGTQELYRDVFTALYDRLPGILQEMQDIQLIYVEDNTAKYRIRKNEIYGGQSMAITYYIYFVIESDGLWKIHRF